MRVSSHPMLRMMKYRVYIRAPMKMMAKTTCVHITPFMTLVRSCIAILSAWGLETVFLVVTVVISANVLLIRK